MSFRPESLGYPASPEAQRCFGPFPQGVRYIAPRPAQQLRSPAAPRIQQLAPPVQPVPVLQVPVYTERPLHLDRIIKWPLCMDMVVKMPAVHHKAVEEHVRFSDKNVIGHPAAPLRHRDLQLEGERVQLNRFTPNYLRDWQTGSGPAVVVHPTAPVHLSDQSNLNDEVSVARPSRSYLPYRPIVKETVIVKQTPIVSLRDAQRMNERLHRVAQDATWDFAAEGRTNGHHVVQQSGKPFTVGAGARSKAVAPTKRPAARTWVSDVAAWLSRVFGTRTKRLQPDASFRESMFPPPAGSVASGLSGRSTPRAPPGDIGALPSDAFGASTEAPQACSGLLRFPPTISSGGCGSRALCPDERPGSTMFPGDVGTFQHGALQCDPDVEPQACLGGDLIRAVDETTECASCSSTTLGMADGEFGLHRKSGRYEISASDRPE